jgi:hypothetical protein
MCVGLPGHSLSRRRRESIGPGLIFLFLFLSREKEKNVCIEAGSDYS